MARVQLVKFLSFSRGLETVRISTSVSRGTSCHAMLNAEGYITISGSHRSHTWKRATPLNLQTRPTKRMNPNELTFCILFVRGGFQQHGAFLANTLFGSHEVLPGEPARLLENTTVSELPPKAPNCVRLAMRHKIGGAEMMFFGSFLGYLNVSKCIF